MASKCLCFTLPERKDVSCCRCLGCGGGAGVCCVSFTAPPGAAPPSVGKPDPAYLQRMRKQNGVPEQPGLAGTIEKGLAGTNEKGLAGANENIEAGANLVNLLLEAVLPYARVALGFMLKVVAEDEGVDDAAGLPLGKPEWLEDETYREKPAAVRMTSQALVFHMKARTNGPPETNLTLLLFLSGSSS